MIRLKKLLISLLVFVIIILGVGIFLYNSTFGEKLFKVYISSKLTMIKTFKIKSFHYSFNSFSAIFQKGNNYIYVYGNIFPFKATYEANLDKLSELTNKLRGVIKSNGEIIDKGIIFINGNALFADGYSNIKFQCDKKCVGTLSGDEFNTKELLQMLKINFPYVVGKNNLFVVFKENSKEIKSNFNVDFKYNEIKLKNMSGTLNMKCQKNALIFNVSAKNNIVSINLKGKKSSNLILSGNIRFPLNLLKKYTLYSFNGISDMNFSIDYLNNILKFTNKYFNGDYSNNIITININQMPSTLFFSYLNLPNLFNGKINGVIKINNDEGNFDLIINKAFIKNNYFINYIKRSTQCNINTLNVLLIKGNFDKNKIIFTILAKNNKCIVTIKQGEYFYNGVNKYLLEIYSQNKTEYIFKINNNKIKLINVLKNVQLKDNSILVF